MRERATVLGVKCLGARVRDVEQADGLSRVVVSAGAESRPRHLDARFVIDANGRRAVIARKLGSKRRRLSELCAVVAWLHHPVHDHDNTTRVKSVSNGWWYTARLPHMLRVLAFHGLPTDVAQIMKRPARFAEACNATDLLPYQVQTADFVRPLKAVDASVQVGEPAAGPGWLAVGDAALSFDPLSSQGVLFALYSGVRGMEAALGCLAHPEFAGQFLDEYQRKVRDFLAANQRARMGLYWGEWRYAERPYWQAQRRGLAAAAREGALQVAAGSPS